VFECVRFDYAEERWTGTCG
jgi:hypothetical protein